MPQVADLERRVFVDPWPPQAFRTDLADPRLAYLRVARRGGALVGYMVAWRVAVEMHLTNLAVHPDARRTGVARELLADLMAEARRVSAEVIALEVRASNVAAIELYRRHGFRQVAVRKAYYEVGREDALVMTLDLAAGGGEGNP